MDKVSKIILTKRYKGKGEPTKGLELNDARYIRITFEVTASGDSTLTIGAKP